MKSFRIFPLNTGNGWILLLIVVNSVSQPISSAVENVPLKSSRLFVSTTLTIVDDIELFK